MTDLTVTNKKNMEFLQKSSYKFRRNEYSLSRNPGKLYR